MLGNDVFLSSKKIELCADTTSGTLLSHSVVSHQNAGTAQPILAAERNMGMDFVHSPVSIFS
jgi:hypothetical protein